MSSRSVDPDAPISRNRAVEINSDLSRALVGEPHRRGSLIRDSGG